MPTGKMRIAHVRSQTGDYHYSFQLSPVSCSDTLDVRSHEGSRQDCGVAEVSSDQGVKASPKTCERVRLGDHEPDPRGVAPPLIVARAHRHVDFNLSGVPKRANGEN